MMDTLPTYDEVVAASNRIRHHANRTPTMTSRTANEHVGAQLFFKCENFQRAGAFKFRGAFNAVASLNAEQRRAGVVAFSSGNHAQAIALSSQLMGVPATIVMPRDAPAVKLAATRAYGADVIIYDRYTEDREKIGRALSESRGLTLIPPYDHRDVIAGQGTSAIELFEDAGLLDALFVPLGGGGLLAGCSLVAKTLAPRCKIYGVEPELGNDGQQSFRSGAIVHIESPATIADGAQTQHLGQLTFPIIKRHVADILTVQDSELVVAMRFFAERMKILVEPTGCLAFAGACSFRREIAGKRIGVLISGGNVDVQRLSSLLLT